MEVLVNIVAAAWLVLLGIIVVGCLFSWYLNRK